MPRYLFHNKRTKKEWADFMTIAEMEEMLEKNPHVRQVLTPINIVAGVAGMSYRSDDGWNIQIVPLENIIEKEELKKLKLNKLELKQLKRH